MNGKLRDGFYYGTELGELAQSQEDGEKRSWVDISGEFNHHWLGDGDDYFNEKTYVFVLPEEYML